MVHQFFIITGASFGQVAVRRLITLALRPRIDRNDVILLRKFVDLLLPDPGRHRPAGNEDDRSAAASFNVVNADAIGGFERTALGGLRCRRRNNSGHRQNAYQRYG